MARKDNYKYDYENREQIWIGPPYPALPSVRRYRDLCDAAGGFEFLTIEEVHNYGDAVGAAIRALQRKEAQSGLPPMPSLIAPKYRPPSIERLAKYTRPNPFRMVGDPLNRDEESLYRATAPSPK